jgi:hypothetical protein
VILRSDALDEDSDCVSVAHIEKGKNWELYIVGRHRTITFTDEGFTISDSSDTANRWGVPGKIIGYKY